MVNKIIELLEKYEDLFMKYTLGSKKDEYGKRYAEEYCCEWRNHKLGIAHIISKLIRNDYPISPEGFAYIMINEWSGVMVMEHKDLNIKKLKSLCRKILNEISL